MRRSLEVTVIEERPPGPEFRGWRIDHPEQGSQLEPGDLVFFYPGSISHVGLYAGNGTILHASRPGKPVQYIKMAYMPYAGARRPG